MVKKILDQEPMFKWERRPPFNPLRKVTVLEQFSCRSELVHSQKFWMSFRMILDGVQKVSTSFQNQFRFFQNDLNYRMAEMTETLL
jgi:hypothetical protein